MVRSLACVVALALLVPAALIAQSAEDDPVAYALAAAPPDLRAEATVIDLDGNVLKEGSNGWTCLPMPGNAMCLDDEWMAWVDAYMNHSDDVQVDNLGIAYMLAGDTGASNIDPFAEGPTPDNEWVQTGAHIMLIVPDPALLEGIPTDPRTGGPYVMWKGHALQHVMIPVDEDGARMEHDAGHHDH